MDRLTHTGQSMKISLHNIFLNRRMILRYVLVVIITIHVLIVYTMSTQGYISGDSGIYYTFCRNFFKLPFSYTEGNVSYGASSPLYCIIISFIYHLFPDNWFFAIRFFSFVMLVLTAYVITKSIDGDSVIYLWTLATALLCHWYLVFNGQGFEVSLITLMISLILYFLYHKRYDTVLYPSGILYLVRYELALVTFIIDIIILINSKNRKRTIAKGMLSFVPILIYTFYMYLMTGELIPSSITGRGYTALEDDSPLFEKWYICLLQAAIEYRFVFCVILTLFVVIVIFEVRGRKKTDKLKINVADTVFSLSILLAVLLPFVIIPTTAYFLRYTVGIVAFVLLAVAFLVKRLITLSGFSSIRAALFIVGMAAIVFESYRFGQNNSIPFSQDKFDICYGKELNDALNEKNIQEGNILMYEIQQQYYLENFHCISLDAIVGSEALQFLEGKESFSDTVIGNDVDYVVTMISALYRKPFRDTGFMELYLKGQDLKVGDHVQIDGVEYTKLIENSAAKTKPLDRGFIPDEYIQYSIVYDDSEPWSNNWLFWDAVYKVEALDE